MYQLSEFRNSLLVWGFAFLLGGCDNAPNDSEKDPDYFFCGAENLTSDSLGPCFNDGNGRFAGGGYQVSDSVFEGKFACKVDPTNEYGMPYEFINVEEGTYFEASVWIKNPVGRATMIVGTTGRTKYTMNTTEVNRVKDSIGWTKYAINLGIESPADTLKFFLFASQETHYFDNFEIRRFAQRPPLADSLSDIAMKLYIPDSSMQLISSFRATALHQDIISEELKAYVNAFIVQPYDSIPIELRLKGDWTDHLESGKTSYRIKTDQAYRGLTTFSIQHPQTRNYMHEWFMHRLCDTQGLLSTTYDFLPVEINGENQGIYALEEHFDKQLLESRSRREGPILKIDETGFWALLASGKKDSLKGSYPYYEAAMITCFKEGRTEKTPVLSKQFERGASLLYLFKNRYPHPEELFDLDQLARYYALMDLGNINHSMAWHNRRFYYNPITAKLEIIGFDMIPAVYPFQSTRASQKFLFTKEAGEDEFALDFYLMSNREFRKYYTDYLYEFSSVAFLDSAFKLLEPEIEHREALMAVEFPNYKLDRSFYYDKAAFIREELKTLDSAWDDFMNQIKTQPEPKIIPPKYQPLTTSFLQKEISVNAYRSMIDSTHFKLQFENYHLADLTVVGYSTKSGKDTVFLLEKPIQLEAFDGLKSADYAEIVLNSKPSKIHFTVANMPGVIHDKKVFAWAKPLLTHPRIELEKQFNPTSSLYEIEGDTLIFNQGKHVIKNMLLIPSNYVVKIQPGTTIDMINRACIITNNSTFIQGTADSMIVITSSDSTSQGFVVLGGDKTVMKHAQFSNLNCLNYDGWSLTGAVTIYESDVTISNVDMGYNQCEDALHMMRSNFNIKYLNLHDTKSDAFDSDFCTGLITNCNFKNTGNDGMDFSGSTVSISNYTIHKCGDKGISSGERSTITAFDISIYGALTACASKDGSYLLVDRIKAENCEVGVSLYRKKPEYPKSKLELKNAEYSDILTKTLIERGGMLQYNGNTYFGYTTFDIDSMYARFGPK